MLKQLGVILITTSFVLSGCSSGDEEEQQNSRKAEHSEHINHQNESQVPKGMHRAEHSQFKKGDKVIVKSNHMPGMKNAKGKVENVYDTYVYKVNYKPTNGQKEVKNHKWVVNEEIKNAPNEGLKKGDKATLEANHMPGMKGAKATIVKVEKTPVYMIDYKSTNNGKWIKNHKWVIGSELQSRK